MLSAVTRPQATPEDQLPRRRGLRPRLTGACGMGDTPVEVALSLRSTRRVRCGTPRQPACGGGRHRRAGALLDPESSESALEYHRAAGWRWCSARRATRWWQARRAWRCSTAAQARWIYAFRSSRTGPRTAPTTARSTAGGSGHGLRQAAGERSLYRVDGDWVTRMLDGLTISNGPAFDEPRGGDSTSPTRPSTSSTSSTWTPRRAPSAVAGGSSISAASSSGQTA